MRRTGTLAIGLLTLGCAGAWNRANVGPFEAYTARLAAPHGLSVARCAMHEATREGSCELEGDAASIEAFLDAHGAQEGPAPSRHGDPCFARYRFGSEVDAPTRTYTVDATTLPSNQDNVHVQHLLRIDGALCVALVYPFG